MTKTPPSEEQQDTTTTTTTTSLTSSSSPTSKAIQPLHDEWTLWYDNPKVCPDGDWKDTLKPCGTFRDVATFWRVVNNVRPPSHLSVGSNYSLFRKGMEPSWEDPGNINGGTYNWTNVRTDKELKLYHQPY